MLECFMKGGAVIISNEGGKVGGRERSREIGQVWRCREEGKVKRREKRR